MTDTQQQLILNHLREGKEITPLDALNLYGSFRLSAVIFDIKALGYRVEMRLVNNGKKKFASYWLPIGKRQLPSESIKKQESFF